MSSFIQGPIDPAFIATAIQKHQHKTEIGAHSIFLGQVRADLLQGKRVVGIEYSTYEEMALKELNEIKETAFSQFGLICAHIYHSVGFVETGAICFFVFTSSPHRAAARDACAFLVDGVKATLPIFGKEVLEDETHHWKVNQ